MVAQIAATIGALVGESITLVMSPNGAIQKMEGMARIMEKMQKTAPQGRAALGMAGLDSMLTDESMKGAFGQSFGHLPGTAVKPGDTWKHDLVDAESVRDDEHRHEVQLEGRGDDRRQGTGSDRAHVDDQGRPERQSRRRCRCR